jgi:hypothetical protein
LSSSSTGLRSDQEDTAADNIALKPIPDRKN